MGTSSVETTKKLDSSIRTTRHSETNSDQKSEYPSWIDENDMLVDEKEVFENMEKGCEVNLPEFARNALTSDGFKYGSEVVATHNLLVDTLTYQSKQLHTPILSGFDSQLPYYLELKHLLLILIQLEVLDKNESYTQKAYIVKNFPKYPQTVDLPLAEKVPASVSKTKKITSESDLLAYVSMNIDNIFKIAKLKRLIPNIRINNIIEDDNKNMMGGFELVFCDQSNSVNSSLAFPIIMTGMEKSNYLSVYSQLSSSIDIPLFKASYLYAKYVREMLIIKNRAELKKQSLEIKRFFNDIDKAIGSGTIELNLTFKEIANPDSLARQIFLSYFSDVERPLGDLTISINREKQEVIFGFLPLFSPREEEIKRGFSIMSIEKGKISKILQDIKTVTTIINPASDYNSFSNKERRMTEYVTEYIQNSLKKVHAEDEKSENDYIENLKRTCQAIMLTNFTLLNEFRAIVKSETNKTKFSRFIKFIKILDSISSKIGYNNPKNYPSVEFQLMVIYIFKGDLLTARRLLLEIEKMDTQFHNFAKCVYDALDKVALETIYDLIKKEQECIVNDANEVLFKTAGNGNIFNSESPTKTVNLVNQLTQNLEETRNHLNDSLTIFKAQNKL